MSMYVVKRNGIQEEISFDKIYKRIKYLLSIPYPIDNINVHVVCQYVIQGLYNGVSTTEIDVQSSIVCANLCIQNYEYAILAGRIAINNHQKNTLTSFKDKIDKLYLHKDVNGISSPIISPSFYKFVKKNQKTIEEYIDYNRDYLVDFFGFKTLEKSYLLRIGNDIVERPQDLFMRVAISLHMNSVKKQVFENIFKTYDLLSNKYFTHATPTLFNAGSPRLQLSSCFLLGSEDSIEGIFKTMSDCAKISKWSGGIGFHINWRSSGSLIRGTNGMSNGIVPFLKIFEKTAIAVNQGGRRPGSFSPYLELHHPDIIGFLELSKKNIPEERKANKLYLALWVCDLFMKRVRDNGPWSTFCPEQCPGLQDCYGEEYETLYCTYENEGKAIWTKSARYLWQKIFESQKESGVPYIVYKDAVNRNSNQKNIGVIKSSNLCSEIVEYSSSTEYAVCSLTSICLPQFVEDSYSENEDKEQRKLNHEFPKHPIFNYEKFKQVVDVNVRNLNKVIDINFYPVPETKRSNLRHRPIGIGVQGLADVFFKFNITFDSPQARNLNKYIFETMYYTAVSVSSKMSREIWKRHYDECVEHGKTTAFICPQVLDTGKVVYTKVEYKNAEDIPKTIGAYTTFDGSPLSEGIFHWQMMGLEEEDLLTHYDWATLRTHIQTFGVCNSLLIALMPTATTSQIMGNIEAFEPLMSNIFIRSTIAGEFIVVNKYLMKDLKDLGMWDTRIENYLKLNNGSIQNIEGIPQHIKDKYKTVWEISQRSVIDLAADRQPFVDQSQSLNLHIENLDYKRFSSMHMYGWERGLKTGCYYLRTQEAITPQKFTVDSRVTKLEYVAPSITGPSEDCVVCGS